MNLLGRSNFDALFAGENVRDDVVRDVLEAFVEEDRIEQDRAGLLRAEAGYINQNIPNFWTDLGRPVMRLTSDDFWRVQVQHNAMADPEVWDWFLKQPDGQYAKVKSVAPRLVVGFVGNKRESIRFT